MSKRGDVMNSIIYDPLQEFESKYKAKHSDNTDKFFNDLVQKSGVAIEKNRETVRLYNEYKDNLAKLKKKLAWWKVLRVILCIIFIFIPLVIWKITPKIKTMKAEIEEADLQKLVAAKGHYPESTPIDLYSEEFVSRWLFPNWERIVTTIHHNNS